VRTIGAALEAWWEVRVPRLVHEQQKLCWEVIVEGGRVTCHDRRSRMDADKMTLYLELIYRRYQAEALMDESALRISMRCYYPDEFVELIAKQGFRVLHQWGDMHVNHLARVRSWYTVRPGQLTAQFIRLIRRGEPVKREALAFI
jgi:hypothetical protein